MLNSHFAVGVGFNWYGVGGKGKINLQSIYKTTSYVDFSTVCCQTDSFLIKFVENELNGFINDDTHYDI
jgi:hypothetical protein